MLYKLNKNRTSSPIMWMVIVSSAILFGLGHLPALASSGIDLTALIVSRTIVLNAVGGVIFGWLYWKKGLELAMVSHFSTDVVLHVLLPLLIS